MTVVPPGGTDTGGGLHSTRWGCIGLAMLPMSYGAVVRGARPAAVALIVLSLAACVIVLFVDRPVLDDTGLFGRTYDLARGAAGDRVLPGEPGRGAGARRRGGRRRVAPARALGNPARARTRYYLRCPLPTPCSSAAPAAATATRSPPWWRRHHATLVRVLPRAWSGRDAAPTRPRTRCSPRCSRSTACAGRRRSARGWSGSASTPAERQLRGSDPLTALRDVRGSDPLTPPRSLRRRELAGRVRAAIAELPRGQREAVTLYYLAGLTPGRGGGASRASRRARSRPGFTRRARRCACASQPLEGAHDASRCRSPTSAAPATSTSSCSRATAAS